MVGILRMIVILQQKGGWMSGYWWRYRTWGLSSGWKQHWHKLEHFLSAFKDI